jgi:hypothetical protein
VLAQVRPRRRQLAAAQAAYYVTSGLVPFVSRRHFERVTGRKADWWLVLAVAGLVEAIGLTLGVVARRRPGPEAVVLGAGSAATLGLIDVVYVRRRVISPVYLADAAAELPLALAWLCSRRN